MLRSGAAILDQDLRDNFCTLSVIALKKIGLNHIRSHNCNYLIKLTLIWGMEKTFFIVENL